MFLSVTFVLFTFSPIFAETPSKLLKYLPHDEAIESVNKEYNPPLRKTGISCAAAFEDASRCFYCVNTLKAKCPDCCLKFSPQRAIRCTPKDSSIYDCKDLAFSSANCTAVANCKCPSTTEECNSILYDCGDCPDTTGVMTCSNIPQCQQKGCPTTEPSASLGRKCISKDGAWICEENNLPPRFSGCAHPRVFPVALCQIIIRLRRLRLVPLKPPPPNDCYEYVPTAEYSIVFRIVPSCRRMGAMHQTGLLLNKNVRTG